MIRFSHSLCDIAGTSITKALATYGRAEMCPVVSRWNQQHTDTGSLAKTSA